MDLSPNLQPKQDNYSKKKENDIILNYCHLEEIVTDRVQTSTIKQSGCSITIKQVTI